MESRIKWGLENCLKCNIKGGWNQWRWGGKIEIMYMKTRSLKERIRNAADLSK